MENENIVTENNATSDSSPDVETSSSTPAQTIEPSPNVQTSNEESNADIQTDVAVESSPNVQTDSTEEETTSEESYYESFIDDLSKAVVDKMNTEEGETSEETTETESIDTEDVEENVETVAESPIVETVVPSVDASSGDAPDVEMNVSELISITNDIKTDVESLVLSSTDAPFMKADISTLSTDTVLLFLIFIILLINLGMKLIKEIF